MAAQRIPKLLQQYVQKEVYKIARNYGFDPMALKFQIPAIAKDCGLSIEEVTRAYGEYMALRKLVDHFDLEVCWIPEGFVTKYLNDGTHCIRYVQST
jgi:hypothetical protein